MTVTNDSSSSAAGRADTVAESLRQRITEGVLSFPLTAFNDAGEVDLEEFRLHVRKQLAAGPAAIFACGGTGEFFSLTEAEYESVLKVAVAEAAGTVPVIAGIGYGWPLAAQFAQIAEAAGVDAALVLPHYLVEAPQPGLINQIKEIAARTPLPLVIYQRAGVRYSPATLAALAEIPNVIGMKDGISDLDHLQRQVLATPDEFFFLNGATTAEMQVRAYTAIGVAAYSSAVHSFAPEISKAFFAAYHAGDRATVDALLSNFYIPFVLLRDRQPGYGISLIKAAARLRGENVGSVRAPLMDPLPQDLEDLEKLIAVGLALVA
jgi:5-dehydro-4-deoxyglucarate dehydratase